ncbi:uncharacterized protein DMENIID0001_114080 [Sergentomyia squamirostris]
MGDLPAARVNPSRPFTHTGVDFTGHIFIKRSPRSAVREKAYVAVFVCLSTKAIHLELVSDMTSKAFIAAFKRFVSRRGLPAHMYSDNGTNFVGGEKELRHILQKHETQRMIANEAAAQHVQWHFNPPGAPHQGGIWEAAVKSFKRHFLRVIGPTPFLYEELNTLIIEIEAVLNSRPLVALTDHPQDALSLTPGDFLTGGALTQMPIEDLQPNTKNRVKRLTLLNKIRHDFMMRWKHEYLNTLQQRNRWNKEYPNLKEGDIVLMRSDLANVKWPLGIIDKVFPGKDNKVRVAQVRSNYKVYERPITKLIKLPIQDE